MENTSGSGRGTAVPAEIDRWNWGAFLFNWIWGIGNNTLVALLMFVPLVNLVMPFVLGARGSRWAWQNKRWESVDAFRATQRRWAFWGLIVLGLSILFFVGLASAIMVGFKHSTAYRMGVRDLNATPQAVRLLGRPISTGFATGSIYVSGPDGKARLSFRAEGPHGKGRVYVLATKSMGHWHIDRAVLEDARSHRRVELVHEDRAAAASP
jgi:hypothetical protein